ncbi:hypothetical protein QAD02_023558 [Eretmocerus hayati]|uniref:Uncharacterized protein n=1 Tax=Eretmocerus hayati TaxID=131215 RepID=A0ACC2PWV5_9HYME|nr:hypothetical protein QAD02_023558 [Eretmocerus hayati]
MKTSFALIFCVALIGICSSIETEDRALPNIQSGSNISQHLSSILSNEKRLTDYLNCLLDEPGTRCSPDALPMKRHTLQKALQSNCERCLTLEKNKPAVLEKIIAKYDKENIFLTKYKNEAEQLGVKIPAGH